MLQALVRAVCLTVVHFFHRQIAVRSQEHIPDGGPLLIVANHPNGLIDPLLIRVAVGREVGFMAKAPLFENPAGKLAMESFAALPVYRAKDGNDTSANERTFAAVRERFSDDRWVVIFPEGHSHSEPSLQRMKTGAARISLSSEAEHDFELGLRILPVGLVYEDKERFRSRVSVVVGEPLPVADYQAAYEADDWEAAKALTAEIGSAIADQMLEAESDEVWNGFLAVARWTLPAAVNDMAACEARAKELAAIYEQLMIENPEEAEAIANEARHFVAMLDAIGVDNPFDLDNPRPPSLGRLIANAAWYAALFLPAMVGWIINAPPYYGIAPLAEKVAGEDTDIISSVKALAGLLFYPLTWLIEAAVVAWFFGWIWGAVTLLAGPLTGIAAVHFFERLNLRRDALVGTWLRFTRRNVVESVSHRRDELARRVNALAPTDM